MFNKMVADFSLTIKTKQVDTSYFVSHGTEDYLCSVDSTLRIPNILPEDVIISKEDNPKISDVTLAELKQILKHPTKKAVVYLYYHYNGMLFLKHKMKDPISTGDELMQETMRILGPDVDYYKVNMAKHRHTKIVKKLNLQELDSPRLFLKLGAPLKTSTLKLGIIPPDRSEEQILEDNKELKKALKLIAKESNP